jgi:hypothetical protein
VTRGDGERPYNTPKKKRGGSIKNREEQSKKGRKFYCHFLLLSDVIRIKFVFFFNSAME